MDDPQSWRDPEAKYPWEKWRGDKAPRHCVPDGLPDDRAIAYLLIDGQLFTTRVTTSRGTDAAS